MRKLFLATIAAGSLAVCSWAQDPAASQPQSQPQTETSQPAAKTRQPTNASNGASSGPTRLAAGSVIPVQLTTTLDAKKVKTGEEVDAKVTQDMKAQNGQLLLAKDTKIVGHITAAQGRTKEQKESQLGIAFDHAVLKEGGNLSLPAEIQAVIALPSQNPENGNPLNQGVGAQSGSGSRSATPGPAGAGGGSPSLTPSASGDQSGAASTPQITASTQGVIGQADYKLSTPGDSPQGSSSRGSVVSSEKSNVKLEGGTLLLLRVSQ